MSNIRDSGFKLRVKLFADTCQLSDFQDMNNRHDIAGFTTNPTFMRQAGVTDYLDFAQNAIALTDKPISFEVFADEFDDMFRQACILRGLGPNVYVKIPITNIRGESSYNLIRQLSEEGVRLNVTACFTIEHVKTVVEAIDRSVPAFISIFAGRIADTGVHPMPVVAEAVTLVKDYSNIEIIWAATREVHNVIEADVVGCHYITAPPDILGRLHLIGKDLNGFSLETIQMFSRDAKEAGYVL